ncbi:unnamed protein product [Linum trigynum]|uniref:Uncharacterized protein n=1 Tax=Linum trigynum TaxID=586398 RepID=A0AAV2EJ66_9ROSI
MSAAGDLKKLTLLLSLVASQASLIFTFSYETCPLLLGATTTMGGDQAGQEGVPSGTPAQGLRLLGAST